MADIDYSAKKGFETFNHTWTAGDVNKARRFVFSPRISSILVQIKGASAAGFYSYTGTDGSDLGTVAHDIDNNVATELNLIPVLPGAHDETRPYIWLQTDTDEAVWTISVRPD